MNGMNAITKVNSRLPMPQNANVTPQQWRVLTDAIFPNARSAESICLAMDYCRARKLDVFKRPVHIVPMWNSSLGREVETVWPGINELQITGARAGWAGMDAPQWGALIKRKFEGLVGKRGQERRVSVEVEFPEWCAVTVYRMVGGHRCSFVEPVYWLEAYGRQGRTDVPNDMWAKRVRGQLHKVAKAASLRAAFPEEAGNDYTADEMEGQHIEAGGVVIDGVAEQEPPAPQYEPLDDEIPALAADGPVYRLVRRDGTLTFASGSEWIAKWRTACESYQKAGAPQRLKTLRLENASAFDAISAFDPAAVAEVDAMIDAAVTQ